MALNGFKEEYGVTALKKEYVERVLSDIMRKHGYDRINIPVIEPFSSYSEDVVGVSPWPEWNEKCVFRFNINDYNNIYESSDCKTNEVCLIPEGTVSITRWLASMIEKGDDYPRKLFYCLKCYRNELISTLSPNKCREFIQFGVEIMDTDDVKSDIEILESVITLLKALGVNENAIRIRVNDVALFNKLVDLCEIGQDDIILLKKNLDYLAECYAGKHTEDCSHTQFIINQIISKYSLREKHIIVWDLIVNHSYDSISDAIKRYPNSFQQDFAPLLGLLSYFKNHNSSVELDLCVIRSHQYYSGLSFEIDVVTEKNKYIEIAGGGRYDRLVGTFLKAKDNSCSMAVPCTGFAFGVDRVISMLDDLDLLSGTKEITSVFNFK